MKVIKSEMHEWAFLVCNVSTKILPYNNIPPLIELKIYLSFDDPCDFAIFLCLEQISKISNLLDSRVGNTDNLALFFRLQVWHFNQYFFEILVFVLLLIMLIIFSLIILLSLVFCLIVHLSSLLVKRC